MRNRTSLARRAVVAVSCAMIVCGAGLACAQEFSADGVAHDDAGHVLHSKISMSAGKVRMDPLDLPAQSEKSYMILDLTGQAAFVVIPGRKTIMSLSAPVARRNLAPFTIGDTPCPANANSPATLTCQNLGAESVNGRSTIKWQLTGTAQGQPIASTIWVDPVFHIVIKSDVSVGGRPVGGNELTNIVPGPQPAALFQLPAGYTRTEQPSAPAEVP